MPPRGFNAAFEPDGHCFLPQIPCSPPDLSAKDRPQLLAMELALAQLADGGNTDDNVCRLAEASRAPVVNGKPAQCSIAPLRPSALVATSPLPGSVRRSLPSRLRPPSGPRPPSSSTARAMPAVRRPSTHMRTACRTLRAPEGETCSGFLHAGEFSFVAQRQSSSFPPATHTVLCT
ncbi:hypothetical protein FOMPIDRAFT_1050573 [Fomitopsis schrenkii]|uniref:Uncharacterized protein n=1 Tax=Fomitopsis schrenkii TaxID=2126942 RepID=S8FDB9_FOMSC|nr:hypothetical protein FOMPIDRAFT_1050573 [Fomitopsis schrenkii]